MASFNNLANETIVNILNYVRVPDIDSFASVSKRLRELVKVYRSDHAQLKEEYSSVWIPRCCQPSFPFETQKKPTRHLVHDIKDFVSAPRYAEYVQQLYINRSRREWNGHDDDDIDRREQTDANSELLRLLVKQKVESPAVEPSSIGWRRAQDLWMDEINDGSEDPLIGLLMTLLPNIRTIHIKLSSHERMFWSTALIRYDSLISIKRLNHRSNWWIMLNLFFSSPANMETGCCRLRSEPTRLFLSRLTKVELVGSKDAERGRFELDELATFAALPSLRSIIVNGVWDPETEDHLFDYETSNVEELAMHDTSVSSETLFDFLGIFRNLRTFDYEPSNPSYCHCAFDPPHVRSALVGHNRKTLTHLRICANNEPKKKMGSLRNLETLSLLELDLSLLINPRCAKPYDIARNLPDSVERIELHLDDNKYELDDYEKVANIIAQMLMLQTMELPKLQDFRFSRMAEEGAAIMEAVLKTYSASQNVKIHFDTVPTSIEPARKERYNPTPHLCEQLHLLVVGLMG